MTGKQASTANAAAQVQWPPWLQPLFAAIDGKDAEGFLSHLDDNATFRFGNAEAVTGKEAIGAAVGGFFQSIASVEHTLSGFWEAPGSVCCHGHSRYVRHDGSDLTVPFANVFYLGPSGRIGEYLIHVDLSSLYR